LTGLRGFPQRLATRWDPLPNLLRREACSAVSERRPWTHLGTLRHPGIGISILSLAERPGCSLQGFNSTIQGTLPHQSLGIGLPVDPSDATGIGAATRSLIRLCKGTVRWRSGLIGPRLCAIPSVPAVWSTRDRPSVAAGRRSTTPRASKGGIDTERRAERRFREVLPLWARLHLEGPSTLCKTRSPMIGSP